MWKRSTVRTSTHGAAAALRPPPHSTQPTLTNLTSRHPQAQQGLREEHTTILPHLRQDWPLRISLLQQRGRDMLSCDQPSSGWHASLSQTPRVSPRNGLATRKRRRAMAADARQPTRAPLEPLPHRPRRRRSAILSEMSLPLLRSPLQPSNAFRKVRDRSPLGATRSPATTF